MNRWLFPYDLYKNDKLKYKKFILKIKCSKTHKFCIDPSWRFVFKRNTD